MKRVQRKNARKMSRTVMGFIVAVAAAIALVPAIAALADTSSIRTASQQDAVSGDNASAAVLTAQSDDVVLTPQATTTYSKDSSWAKQYDPSNLRHRIYFTGGHTSSATYVSLPGDSGLYSYARTSDFYTYLHNGVSTYTVGLPNSGASFTIDNATKITSITAYGPCELVGSSHVYPRNLAEAVNSDRSIFNDNCRQYMEIPSASLSGNTATFQMVKGYNFDSYYNSAAAQASYGGALAVQFIMSDVTYYTDADAYASGTIVLNPNGGTISGSTANRSYTGPFAQYSSAGITLSPNAIVAATHGITSGTDLQGNTTAVVPVRSGYEFQGWWSKDGTTSGDWGTEATSYKLTSAGPTTFYAKWSSTFTVKPITINAFKYIGSATTATTVPAATTFNYTFAETDSNTTKAQLAGTSLSSSVTKTISVASGTSLPASGSYNLVDTVGAGFGNLTFSKGGTYTFSLTETNIPSKWSEVSTVGGPVERDLTVQVGDDGTIQSVTWTTGDNGKKSGTASAWQDFYNTYDSFTVPTLTLSVGKYIKTAESTAGTVPAGGAVFTFGLTETDSNAKKATAGAITLSSTDPYEALVNVAAGTAIPTSYGTSPTQTSQWYNTISFPQAGTYTFKVEELSPPARWSYDTATASTSRTLTVTVGSDGTINTITWSDATHGSYSGTGTTAASAEADFYNTFGSSLTINTKTADFAFKSLTTDSDATTADTVFNYTLAADTAQYSDGTGTGTSPLPKDSTGADQTTGSVTLPSGTTASTAAQHIDFGSITFTKPGIYKYKITENDGGAAHWTYETTSKDVYVTVGYGTDATQTALKLIDISTTAPTGIGTYQEIIPVASTQATRNWQLPSSPVVQRYTVTSSTSDNNPITLKPTIPTGATILDEEQKAYQVSSNSSSVTANPSNDTGVESNIVLKVKSTDNADGTIVFTKGALTSTIDNSYYGPMLAKIYQFVTVTYATLNTTQATFKNKYSMPTADLKVSKTVSGDGAATADNFGVRVILKENGSLLAGTYDYVKPDGTTGTVTLNTVSSVSNSMSELLKSGQSFTIKGLPTDVTYTVTEPTVGTNWDTWAKIGSGSTWGHLSTETGTISTGTDANAIEFRNVYTVPTSTSDLTIAKKVTGTGAPSDATFDYNIELTNGTTALTGTYNYTTTGGGNGTITGGSGTVSGIKAGESFTITGLPAGTTYTATEADKGADWTPSWTGTENELVIPLASITPDPVSGYTKWGKTVTDYAPTGSTFTGLKRTITGIPELSSTYTVQLMKISGTNPDPANDTEATPVFYNAIGTFNVGTDGIEFTPGQYYSLVENSATNLGNKYYLLVKSTGQTTASTTATASTVTGTVGAMDNVTFTNAYAKTVAGVTLTKVGANQTAGNYDKLAGAMFNIYKYVGSTALTSANIDTVAAAGTDTSVWQPITDVDGTTSAAGSAIFYISDANGVLKNGTTLPKLKPNTYYMIVETGAPSGYTKPLGQWAIQVDTDGKVITNDDAADPLAKKGTDGNLPPALAYSLNVGGATTDGQYIVDMPIFSLPRSGGGMLWLVVVSGLGMLALAWALGSRHRINLHWFRRD